jgi:hypothetical protein
MFPVIMTAVPTLVALNERNAEKGAPPVIIDVMVTGMLVSVSVVVVPLSVATVEPRPLWPKERIAVAFAFDARPRLRAAASPRVVIKVKRRLDIWFPLHSAVTTTLLQQ